MVADDTFPKPDDARPGDPTEGVRIIGAEEAAEAFERGEVASRRGGDKPKYGDRPKAPPVGPRPALRFPLEPSADPTRIDKPAPRSSGIAFEPLSGTGGGGGQRFDPQRADADLPEPLPAEPEPEPRPEPRPERHREPVAADEPSTPVELPHWSEPPTGEVPKVLAPEGDDDDLDAWSSFAGSAPRWRDSGDRDWEHGESVHEVLGEDEGWRIGAMDDSRPTHEELYSFENLDQDVADAAEPPLDEDVDLSWPEERVDEPVQVGGKGGRPGGRRTPPQRRNPVAEWAGGSGTSMAPPPGAAPMGRNVGMAAAVGIGFAAVALFLFNLGPKFAMVLVVPILGMAAVEYFNAVRRAGYQPAVLLGLVATVAFPLAAYWRGPSAFPLLLVMVVITSLMWHLVGADGEARVVESVGVTMLGVFWIGGLGSFAALMLAPSTTPHGTGFLITAVLATVGYDVGGFFVGRTAGTRQLSAASPNKTVEGLAGGFFVSLILTTIIVGGFGIMPFESFGGAALVALAAALVAPLGDLAESLVKRDLGIKDMGSILPEHGGLLDRFDALLFVLPAVYYVAIAFDLLG